jgi:YD repeat-containing protein
VKAVRNREGSVAVVSTLHNGDTLGPGLHDTSYSYDAANRMQSGRTVDYGYDANSNQTTRIVPNATDKTWIQTFDAENRLIQVSKTKGTETKTVSFSYDPFGRRVGKLQTIILDRALLRLLQLKDLFPPFNHRDTQYHICQQNKRRNRNQPGD